MKTIWKYSLAVTDILDLDIGVNSTILTVQVQNGIPCLWVLRDPNDKGIRRIVTYGTGHSVSNDSKMIYIGTYQLYEGSFIGHVFEMLN